MGAAAFLALLATPAPAALGVGAWRTAAVAVLMGVWWMTEAIPIPATALLPLVLFPLLGVLPMDEAAAPYANELIFLFMGGFFLAVAMEGWNLHKRIALAIVAMAGTGPERLVLGFMLATAFLSMWISNTATTAMMLPIGMAVATIFRPGRAGDGRAEGRRSARGGEEAAGPAEGGEEAAGRAGGGVEAGGEAPARRGRPAPSLEEAASELDEDAEPYPFGTALMLGIAYGASIGGVSTLIGTPPNAVLAGAASEMLDVEIGFLQWMFVGLPVAAVMLPLAWLLLVRVLYPPGRVSGDAEGVLKSERASLGRVGRGEATVAVVFGLTALAWVMRAPKTIGGVTVPGIQTFAPAVSDATIAMAAAAALFLIPVDWRNGRFALGWERARTIPWGVLILFGGGLSLARAMDVTGLAAWIGGAVTALAGVPAWVLFAAAATLFVFLTEMTSNTATSTMAMPVMVGAAVGLGTSPVALMVAAALAASMAFMLPVATPPNAIVFASPHVTIPRMMRAGFFLNLLAIVIITGAVTALVPRFLPAGP